jgi:nucleotide-binding universal stress UspA family protein
MRISGTYLVPIDFSKGSKVALKRALELKKGKRNGKLFLAHVIPLTLVVPGEGHYLEIVQEKTALEVKKLARSVRLKTNEYRLIVVRSGDVARAIADLALRIRASMIVMGSHGRTGFQRFMLGSVAERTLRYSQCPVLVVKK